MKKLLLFLICIGVTNVYGSFFEEDKRIYSPQSPSLYFIRNDKINNPFDSMSICEEKFNKFIFLKGKEYISKDEFIQTSFLLNEEKSEINLYFLNYSVKQKYFEEERDFKERKPIPADLRSKYQKERPYSGSWAFFDEGLRKLYSNDLFLVLPDSEIKLCCLFGGRILKEGLNESGFRFMNVILPSNEVSLYLLYDNDEEKENGLKFLDKVGVLPKKEAISQAITSQEEEKMEDPDLQKKIKISKDKSIPVTSQDKPKRTFDFDDRSTVVSDTKDDAKKEEA